MKNKINAADKRLSTIIFLMFSTIIVLSSSGAWAAFPNAAQEQSAEQQQQEQKQAPPQPATTNTTQTAATASQAPTSTETEIKPWFVDGTLETHWMAITDNYPRNDIYNMLYLRGSYDVNNIGRFAVRFEMARRYSVDPEESSFLLGDIRLYYSRALDFAIAGQKFGCRGIFYTTLPVSKSSRFDSNITRPTLQVALSKTLPYGIALSFSPYLRFNWDKYAEREGGAANTKWNAGFELAANYVIPLPVPWHRNWFDKKFSATLTFGQDNFTKYETLDGEDQPWNDYLYWEASLGYSALTKPVSLDFSLALGSTHLRMEDGVWTYYWLDRDETEMYFSVSARF